MNYIYYEGIDNVGDELNRFIWRRLFGPDQDDGVALLGVGTLLEDKFCRQLQMYKKVLVLGSGAGYGKLPKVDERWSFYSVRGRWTSDALGLSPKDAVADAAYLLATLNWEEFRAQAGESIGVVPHHASMQYIDWGSVCSKNNLTLISPTLPPLVFLKELAKSRLVICEAMHGAILADVLRVPWVPIRFGHDFLDVKWMDWMGMFDLQVPPAQAPSFYDPLRYAAARGPLFHLSRKLKSDIFRFGLGRSKWKKVIPPGQSKGKSGRLLREFLMGLAVQSGHLSSSEVFNRRVNELYARVELLGREQCNCVPGRLCGSPETFFAQD